MRRFCKKRLLSLVLTASSILALTSCGTVLHPERRGQPPGRLDPAIVVLDAVGLIFFFVPGIIAFAVDFSNGTIYLPPEHSAHAAPAAGQELRKIRMSSGELTPRELEAVVRQHTGQTIRLEPGAYRALPLKDIKDFPHATLESPDRSQITTVTFPGKSD